MKVRIRSLFVLLGLMALGACSDDKEAGSPASGGQVREGSISDAMLPYDTVRSQAPLAPRPSSSASSDAASAETDVPTDKVDPSASAMPAVTPGGE